MTPVDLGAELKVAPLQVRRYLRANFPRSDAEKHQRWALTPEMVRAVRAHFANR